MRLVLCLLLLAPLLQIGCEESDAEAIEEGTQIRGQQQKADTPAKPDVKKIYGKIQFVTSFPDYKVQVVDSFPDLKVQKVQSFPNKPGKWQIVDSFPDYKIQIVESFPDFKIKYVTSFPGTP